MSDNVIVGVRRLTKDFGTTTSKVHALRQIDLNIRQGEFLTVMGPSGCGKSTLLHLIGGLDAPTSGAVRVAGEDLNSLNDDQLTQLRRKQFGFVFQAFNLLDVLSARENVALPLIIAGVAETNANQRANEALELVDMSERAKHLPSELSGGQQQRLAIARALVTRPMVLLADEPTGNLDSSTSDQIMRVLRNLADSRNQTIMMVTHNPRHAAMADRMVEMRDGRIECEYSASDSAPLREIVKEIEAKQ